jgi:hypothetical protein
MLLPRRGSIVGLGYVLVGSRGRAGFEGHMFRRGTCSIILSVLLFLLVIGR